MSEIETFLQQLDETERLARNAGGRWRMGVVYGTVFDDERSETVAESRWESRAEHIAHLDPAWALRWVAAVREILDEHEPSTGDHNLRGEPIPPYCRCCSDCRGDYSEPWPCPTVRALMSVYQEEGS